MPPLNNPRHEQFAQTRAGGATLVDAYEAAGFARHAGRAWTLGKRPEVAARIRELQEAAADASTVSAEQIVRELARVGFADIRRLFTQDGRLKLIDDLDDATAAAVASIEVIERPDGQGGIELVRKVKLLNKIDALNALGKHHGLFVERRVHGVEGDLAEFLRSLRGSSLPVTTDETRT